MGPIHLFSMERRGIELKFHLIFWIFIVILGLGPSVEAGEIYEWIDQDGVRHFTDGPPPPGAQLVEGLSDTQSGEPPAAGGATDDGNKGAAKGEEPGPSDVQEAGAVEEGGQDSTSREAYWRRRGWGNGPPNPEDTGTIEDGERVPPDSENAATAENAEEAPPPPEDTDAAGNGERSPGGEEDQWRSRGW